MTIPALFASCHEKLAEGLTILPDKGEESVNGTLCALWLAAAGQPVSWSVAENTELPELDNSQRALLDALIAERLAGKPLAYITGWQAFMGLDFELTPAALIPRKETELLAEVAIGKIGSARHGTASLTLIDVCTGMGNLAITFASRFDDLEILASDLSTDAVELARQNAERLGVGERIAFAAGDLLEPFDNDAYHGNVDFLVCNPPYITSAKVRDLPAEISSYEPDMAFDGGVFGINFIQRLTGESVKYLRAGGWLMFEVGIGQGDLLLKRMKKGGLFTQLDSRRDDDSNIRVLLAQK